MPISFCWENGCHFGCLLKHDAETSKKPHTKFINFICQQEKNKEHENTYELNELDALSDISLEQLFLIKLISFTKYHNCQPTKK